MSGDGYGFAGGAEDSHCPSCRLDYRKHLGLVGTCAALKDAQLRIHKARMALLKIWPDGESCGHKFAQDAFRELK